MTPEREAEIRRWLGPGPYATGGAEMIVADLLAAYDALASGSALREARAEAAECRRRAGDAEERCGVLGRMLANAPSVTERERLTRERDVVRRALDDEQRAHEVTRERWQHAVADSDRWERAHDALLADWREVDSLPAVRAAFCEGMKLSDAVAAALADVHYAEGTPLFDAEVAKREAEERAEEAERERDEARASLALSVAAWDAAGMQGRDAATLVRERDAARRALREMERERVAAVEYADRRDIASQSAHGVSVAEIAANLVPSQDKVIAKLTRCPRCDRAAADAADFARDQQPGDDALCWDGAACREIDWRARALAAEASTVEWRAGALAEAKALGRVIGLREALAAAMEPTVVITAWKAREAVIERIRGLLAGGES